MSTSAILLAHFPVMDLTFFMISQASPPFKPVNFGPQNFQSSSAPQFYENSKTAQTRRYEGRRILIGTVLKLSASSIDLAGSQGLIRGFDFFGDVVVFEGLSRIEFRGLP